MMQTKLNEFSKIRGVLPWARCNLFRNPFGELTREERAELAILDVRELAKHVVDLRSAVQLIGECGRGKTTRMLALKRLLPDASYVYLDEDLPCCPIPYGNPLLIDEAQRLPRDVMRTLFSSGLPLILATHRDLSRQLLRFGYTVTTYPLGQSNDASFIMQAMNRRIEASRLNPAPVPIPKLSMKDAEALRRRFGSDIRAIESHLYEQVQKQVNSDGEMRFID
ncbi:hypothetical protein Q31b_15150 [Novipirellula aureliae]|uniref:AAA+ ATPase domain-containing protein n=1 Tax=Novipirellula aureliae TaxID=2527966 RepID=A0A5C6E8H2_9BACT|nr:hypothetical protein [Novipirellula aureliae]TWU43981.1 hypothetical protein Q31b_15150 [Novipirellula aureliae]